MITWRLFKTRLDSIISQVANERDLGGELDPQDPIVDELIEVLQEAQILVDMDPTEDN